MHTLSGDKAWPSLCDRVKAISYADGPEAEARPVALLFDSPIVGIRLKALKGISGLAV